MKILEPNVTAEILTRFKTDLETEILNSLKRVLKQEIRIELGEHQTFDNTVQKAIGIESNLKMQNKLRNATTSILFNFETPNSSRIKPVRCQLCREINREALFCMKASCIYCKSKVHMSYHCRATEYVIRLICKLCSTEGHLIDACKLGTMPNTHCQHCQNMGHEVAQCPTIAEYELCCKCKERGHDPLTCNKASRITESCEGCGSAAHTIKNYPSA